MTSSPVRPLFTRALKGWFSAKGFWLVVAAALLPLALTGAWVGTHRMDVAVTDLAWEPATFKQGTNATLSATVTNLGSASADGFNVTVAVGTAFGNTFFPAATNETRVDHLAPGESRVVRLSWNATPGILYAVATADTHDTPGHEGEGEIGEVDELNNQKVAPVAVGYVLPSPASAPNPPPGLAGDENATEVADLSVTSVDAGSGAIAPGQERTITATVRNDGPTAVTNATVTLRVGEDFGGSFFASQDNTTTVALAPGESTTVTLAWSPSSGAYWMDASIAAPNGTRDPDASNNHATKATTVDPVLPPDLAPITHTPKYTIKIFYIGVLGFYLRLILPLVALFYAAGIIADERDRKVLTYILTKPTPRWVFPLTKFVASFLVAAVAVTIGVVLTYGLLFGTTPEASEIGFLTTPLFATLLSLLAYGAFFTLIGVYFERPFLAGLAFIAWEAVDVPFVGLGAAINSLILVPWMQNLSIAAHLLNALNAWPATEGVHLLPTGEGGMRAVLVLAAIIVGSLIAAATVMRRKEFDG